MFERLKRLYKSGRLTEAGVKNAVKKNLITETQANEILASTNE